MRANIFCSLQKESFVLMIPAFILLFYHQHNTNLKDQIYTLFSAGLFIIEICIIIFCVGTDKTGYAGFSADTSF